MDMFNMGRVPPVTFGSGRVAKLPSLVRDIGGGPVLIVADAILADLGVTDRLAQDLAAKGIVSEVAADVAGEPKDTLVDELCEKARAAGAKTVIGIGGGAAVESGRSEERRVGKEGRSGR